MTKDEESRMINEKLDYYTLQTSDEDFDVEEVQKLVKRLDEFEPILLLWESDEEALEEFWKYCAERGKEEQVIAKMEH